MGRIPFVLLAISLARPRRVLLVWLLGLALAGVGVARLEIDTSTDNVLDRSGETWPRCSSGSRVSLNCVRYDPAATDDWLRERTRANTSQSA